MSHADRVKDVIAAAGGGTGNLTLAGTPPDATYFTLASCGTTGATFDYWIADGTNVEVGKGTIVSTNVFSRAVQKSTNANAAVNWSAGAVFQTGISAATLNAFLDAASVATMSNKRFTPRVLALSGAIGSPTYSSDSYDLVELLAVTGITDLSTNLTGTPVKGDTLAFHITDNGTSRSIPWGTKFEDSTLTKPAVTVVSQKLSVWFEWNAATSKWRLTGYA